MADKILQKIKEQLPEIQEGVLLKNYTSYKIGGPAKYFFVAKTKEDLINAVKVSKSFKLPVFILGGGSNLLISDKGFKGLVVKIDISNVEWQNNTAIVGAGANLTKLAHSSADKGLAGLEWAAGIPGTVGGAIYGCAQAFNTKISDAVESVDALDIKALSFKTYTKEECKFSLKNSIFKNPPAGGKNLVIVSAVLEFKEGSVDQIKNKIKEFLKYRRTRHPINFPSAGSTFVNPEIKIKNKKLLEKFPELNTYNEKGVIPAGYLISKSGLAGYKIGGAQISEKHANFIINTGKGPGGHPAKDVLALINLAKKKVKANFNIKLEVEVQVVGS